MNRYSNKYIIQSVPANTDTNDIGNNGLYRHDNNKNIMKNIVE